MPLMWAASSAVLVLVLGVPIGIATFIGGAVAPTDPVLASTIIGGATAEENIPSRIRHLIIVESGANDGLGYAFVLLPFALFGLRPGTSFGNWLIDTMVWSVGGAIVFGAMVGIAAGFLANWSFARRATEGDSFLGLTLALSLVTLGALNLIGTNALLGVFAAGLAFSETLGFRGHALERAEHVQEAVERFFDLPVFVVLGTILPWRAWIAMGWRAWVLVLAVLAFRRIPAVLLLCPIIGNSIQRWSEALFVGWFGPIGISALYYATLTLPESEAHAVWGPITLLVTGSIVAHGVSATHLTKMLGRHLDRLAARRGAGEDKDESIDAHRQHIAQHVRETIQEHAHHDIQEIVSTHLLRYRQQALERRQRDRIRLMDMFVADRVPAHRASSSREAIQAVSQEIASQVAQHAADTAATDVAKQIARNTDNEPDDGSGSN